MSKNHNPCLHLVPWLWRKQLLFGKSRLGKLLLWDHQLSPAFLPRSWPKSCKACALRIRICQGLVSTIPQSKCVQLPWPIDSSAIYQTTIPHIIHKCICKIEEFLNVFLFVECACTLPANVRSSYLKLFMEPGPS